MEEVNYYLRKLDSDGLLSRWFTEAAANATKCNTLTKMLSSHGKRNFVLALPDVGAIFYIALLGAGLASISFVAEAIIGMMGKPKKGPWLAAKPEENRAWGEEMESEGTQGT